MGPWPKFAGEVLLTVGAGRLRHYDCARREILREAPCPPCSVAAFLPDAARIALSQDGEPLRLLDREGTLRGEIPLPAGVDGCSSLHFPAPDRLLLGSGHFVYRWDGAWSREERMRLPARPGLSPDAALCVLASLDPLSPPEIVRVGTWEPVRTLAPVLATFSRLAWAPDGATVAGAGAGQACLWDAMTGEVRWKSARAYAAADVAFTPDSRRVAVSEIRRDADVLEVATGRSVGTLPRPNPRQDWLAFSEDGRWAAIGERVYHL